MLSSQPERGVNSPEPRGVDGAESLGAFDFYWKFYGEVATRQLDAWLPEQPVRILDLADSAGSAARRAAGAGHDVVRVVPLGHRSPTESGNEKSYGPDEKVRTVVADASCLSFLADATVDAVIAERLSSALATESTVADIARVLRPGGHVLLRVDSLLLGMARLAQQQRWAELSDAPSAEVLLVPGHDGSITRCFWPEELRELLVRAGLQPEWIRPRTVLSPSVVQQALAEDPGALDELVRTELSLPPEQADESVGIHLIASARRAEKGH